MKEYNELLPFQIMAENTHNEQKWEAMITISDNAQQRIENAELKTKLQKE